MRRIKMLEYALRMERFVLSSYPHNPTHACSFPLYIQLHRYSHDMRSSSFCQSAQSSWLHRLAPLSRQNRLPSSSKVQKMTSRAIGMEVVAARHGVTVRVSEFLDTFYLGTVFDADTHATDSPLPSERAPNGTSATRPPSWSGTNANWGAGPPSVGSVGKPPPGRDPKSRARSRDYLKQYVLTYLAHFVHAHGFPQMSSGDLLSYIPTGNEPTPESPAHLFIRESHATSTIGQYLQWSTPQDIARIWTWSTWIGE
jgi:hypothetical protein